MTKKKKIILISGILLIIIGIILAVFLFKKPQENCSNCEVELTKDSKPKQQVNAYDYIVQTMNEPEYWGVERMYDYFSEEEVQERLNDIPNGSGWNLKDVNTASFIRGYDNKLIYNFSNFTATAIDEHGNKTIFDFMNNKYQSYFEDNFEFERELIKEINDPNLDTLYQSGNLNNFKTYEYRYSNIKNSMLNYAYLFEQAGCPILLQPEGTLESYKNKMATPVENYQKINMNYGDYYEARKNVTDYWGNPYADSSKIDAPWELEDYCYDIREREDLQWINDYTKVDEYVKELPDIIYKPENQECSQANIIFVSKDFYEWEKENFDMYPNATSNLFTYYNKIILEKVYGKDVTYYCDMKNMKNEVLLPVDICIKDEQFPRLGFVSGADSHFDGEITVFKSPQTEEWKYKYEFHDIGNMRFDGDINEAFGSTEELRIGSDTKNPFSDIYQFNLLITIDKNLQTMLGLR